MPLNIASAYVELSARGLSTINTQLHAASAATRRTGREMEHRFGRVDRVSQKLSRSLGKIPVPLAAIGAAAGAAAVALGAMAARGVKLATDLEQAMANVSTMVDTSTTNIRAMSDEVLDMTTRVNKSATDLADGLYQVISAGIDSSKAMRVLEVSAKAATAGLSNTETAVDAITSVLNAYGKSAEEAAHVSDVMFEAAKAGKLTFGDIASSIGRVLPLANSMSITFEEVAAVTANLSKVSPSYAESVTGLRQVLVALAKPSEQAKKAAAELGIEFGQAAVQSKGLTGVLEDLQKIAKSSPDALAKLFGDVEGYNAALQLTKGSLEDVVELQQTMLGAQGSTAEAFGKQMNTLAGQITRLKLEISRLLTHLGNVFVPTLTKFIAAINGVIKGVERVVSPAESRVEVARPATQQEGTPERTAMLRNLPRFVLPATGPQALIAQPRVVQPRIATESIQEAARVAAEITGVTMGQAALRTVAPIQPTVIQPTPGILGGGVGRQLAPIPTPGVVQPGLVTPAAVQVFDALVEQPKATGASFTEARKAVDRANKSIDEMADAADKAKEGLKFDLKGTLVNFVAEGLPGAVGAVAQGAMVGAPFGPVGIAAGAGMGLLQSMPKFQEMLDKLSEALQPVIDIISQILTPVLQGLGWIFEKLGVIVAKIVNVFVGVINAILGLIDKIPFVNVGRLEKVEIPGAEAATVAAQGGVHISEITGRSRDILVDLLSPLRKLDTLPQLFEGLRTAIYEMRDALLAGGGTGSVHIDALTVNSNEAMQAETLNGWLGARVMQERRTLGVMP